MSGKTDLVLSFLAATAIHAGVLTLGAVPDGGKGGGDAGEDRISLAAASPQIAAMVQDWDRAPEVSQVHPFLAPPRPTDTATDRPSAETPAPVAGSIAALDRVATPQQADTLAAAAPDHPVPSLADATKPITQSAPDAQLARPASPSLTQPAPVPLEVLADTNPPHPDLAPRLAARPPARPAPVPSPAVTRKIATGLGDTGTRGRSASAAPAPTGIDRQAATAAWAADIQRRIARHHRYPRDARTEGRVRVAMVILPGGQLDRVTVAKSSGVAALDRAALAAVKSAAPFPPAPNGLDDDWFSVGQWITFRKR